MGYFCLHRPSRSCLTGEAGGLDCLSLLVFCGLQPAEVLFACFLKFTNRKEIPTSYQSTSSVSLGETEASRLENVGIYRDEDVIGMSSTGFLTICLLLLQTVLPATELNSAWLSVRTTVVISLCPAK